MSSPFPGMDPYLEDPGQWPGVHQRLITYAADALQPILRPRCHVLIGERVYIAEPPQNFYPEVTLVQYPAQRESGGGSIAVVEADAPTVIGESLGEATVDRMAGPGCKQACRGRDPRDRRFLEGRAGVRHALGRLHSLAHKPCAALEARPL